MKWLGSIALGVLALLYAGPVRAEEVRANSIAITSFCFALGTFPGAIYYGFDEPGARPLWVFHAGIAPSIPRAVVHDWLGTALFSSVRSGSILLAERWRNVETSHGMQVGGEFLAFGYALPLIAGIVDLATTPHRQIAQARPAVPMVTIDIRRREFGVNVTIFQ